MFRSLAVHALTRASRQNINVDTCIYANNMPNLPTLIFSNSPRQCDCIVKLLPTIVLLILLECCMLSGCGTTPGSIGQVGTSFALAVASTTIATGQTDQLTIAAKDVPPSTVTLALQCGTKNCGSLQGTLYTAPSAIQNAIPVNISAYSSISGVASSTVTVTVIPPPTIDSTVPAVLAAGTTQKITINGTGFFSNSTAIMASQLNGGTATIDNVSFVSTSQLVATISTPANLSGTVSLTVKDQAPNIPQSSPVFLPVSSAITNGDSGLSTFDVSSYGASGSPLTYSCSGAAGSDVLTCDQSSNDFLPGQGIRIVAAGGPPYVPAIAIQPVVTRQGHGPDGSHMYCYIVANADGMGGISTFSPPACIDDEPALSFKVVYNTILVSSQYSSPLAARLWYVSEDGGQYRLFDVGNGIDVGQQIGSRGGWPQTLPSGSPDISKNEDLFTSVKSIQGNEIVLNDPLIATVSHTVVDHDDTAAIQKAIDSADAVGGGIIRFGHGQYNIRKPQFAARDFTPTNDESLAIPGSRWNYLFIAKEGPGNIYLEGDGASTVLQTPPDDAANGVIFGMADPEWRKYGSPGYAPWPLLKILDARIGSTTLTLANDLDQGALKPGDDIWIYSGNFSPGPSSCIDQRGTAGGGCHFSEFNTVTSIQGETITLAYPLSKNYYDDGRDSFGIVVLPSLVHNIALEHMTLNTYDPVFYGSFILNLLVNDVKINGSVSQNPFGGGYKRNVLIENSAWSLGESDVAWHGTDEYDQWNDVAFVNNSITGHAAAGAEGPSEMARMYMTEGASGFIFEGNTFNHVSLLFQDTTDDVVGNNRFIDGTIAIGTAYETYIHRYLMVALDNMDVISFGSQESVDVDHNDFDISSDYIPPWVIRVGHFKTATIADNVINYYSDGASAVIMANSGNISNNVITVNGNDLSETGIAVIPDEGPGLDPSSFEVRNNAITANGLYAGIYAVDAGFANTADICIESNVIHAGSGNPIKISEADAASVNCN
jgi:hypothetical protein